MKKGIIAAIVAVVALAGIATIVLVNKKGSDKKDTTTNSSSTGAAGSTGNSSSTGSNSGSGGTDKIGSGGGAGSSSSSSTTASSPVAADKVSITNFAYNSDNITVKKGTAVTWTNEDSAQHTVTIDTGTGPHSQPLGKGDTYTYTFNEAGTYKYHCAFHPGMTATVTVTE